MVVYSELVDHNGDYLVDYNDANLIDRVGYLDSQVKFSLNTPVEQISNAEVNAQVDIYSGLSVIYRNAAEVKTTIEHTTYLDITQYKQYLILNNYTFSIVVNANIPNIYVSRGIKELGLEYITHVFNISGRWVYIPGKSSVFEQSAVYVDDHWERKSTEVSGFEKLELSIEDSWSKLPLYKTNWNK